MVPVSAQAVEYFSTGAKVLVGLGMSRSYLVHPGDLAPDFASMARTARKLGLFELATTAAQAASDLGDGRTILAIPVASNKPNAGGS